MSGDMFRAYVEQCLVAALERDDVVEIDNFRAYRVARRPGGDRESGGDTALPAEVLAQSQSHRAALQAISRTTYARRPSEPATAQFAPACRSSGLETARSGRDDCGGPGAALAPFSKGVRAHAEARQPESPASNSCLNLVPLQARNVTIALASIKSTRPRRT